MSPTHPGFATPLLAREGMGYFEYSPTNRQKARSLSSQERDDAPVFFGGSIRVSSLQEIPGDSVCPVCHQLTPASPPLYWQERGWGISNIRPQIDKSPGPSLPKRGMMLPFFLGGASG